ncbi:tyrosine-type recombinase/integrase [Vibrio fluvialis]
MYKQHLVEKYGITLRIRKNSWQADYTLADGTRKQRSRKTIEEAIDLAIAEIEATNPRPKKAVATKHRVIDENKVGNGTLWDSFVIAVDKRWNADKQRDWRKSQRNARWALEFFGYDADASVLTMEGVDAYATYLEVVGNSDATVNRKMAALKVMAGYAYAKGWLTYPPKIDIRKESHGRDYVISRELEQRMVDYFKEAGHKTCADFVTVSIATGCRVSELLTLEWDEVDLASGSLTITRQYAKNGKARCVPLMENALHVMKVRRLSGVSKPFADLTADRLAWRWSRMKQALDMTEVRDFVPHIMRHTCASRIMEADVESFYAKEWLGHGSDRMLQRYAHMNKKRMVAVANRVQALTLAVDNDEG